MNNLFLILFFVQIYLQLYWSCLAITRVPSFDFKEHLRLHHLGYIQDFRSWYGTFNTI